MYSNVNFGFSLIVSTMSVDDSYRYVVCVSVCEQDTETDKQTERFCYSSLRTSFFDIA